MCFRFTIQMFYLSYTEPTNVLSYGCICHLQPISIHPPSDSQNFNTFTQNLHDILNRRHSPLPQFHVKVAAHTDALSAYTVFIPTPFRIGSTVLALLKRIFTRTTKRAFFVIIFWIFPTIIRRNKVFYFYVGLGGLIAHMGIEPMSSLFCSRCSSIELMCECCGSHPRS